MYFISALVVGVFLPLVHACSLIPGSAFYSSTQRTILAPIVFQAKVLNTTEEEPPGQLFDICVKIERIFKSPFEIPPELCFGSFGIEELCLSYVFPDNDYVFFVDEDFSARYDGVPVSAIQVSDELVSAVERGYCSGETPPLRDSCVPPQIEEETFKPMNRIPEGGKAVVNCLASGSLPVITNWYRGGELVLDKQRGNMLEITDATMYDTGRYVCTVKNPAGEATAETYVQILSSACGGLVAVDENATVTIESPEYPWPYRKAKSCSWRVCPPQGMKLEFNFTTFDLRTFDKLEIINECDQHRYPWRKYCGSKVLPGVFVSRCNSTCMQIVLNSGILTNRVATGFQATVRATDEESTEFNVAELFCSSNLVARVTPSVKFQIGLEVNVILLEILKQDELATVFTDQEISIKHGFTITDMCGCSINFKLDSEYYVFASYDDEDGSSYVMDFAVDPSNNNTPTNFVQRLNRMKEDPPQCEALPAK